MSSAIEQRLSMEELKQRNRPAIAWTPSQEDWNELTALLWDISRKPANYPTYAQIEELTRSVRALQQTVEQAGRKKERPFSLPKIRRPELHLDRDSLIKFIVALGFLLGLCAVCYSLVQILGAFLPLFQ